MTYLLTYLLRPHWGAYSAPPSPLTGGEDVRCPSKPHLLIALALWASQPGACSLLLNQDPYTIGPKTGRLAY